MLSYTCSLPRKAGYLILLSLSVSLSLYIYGYVLASHIHILYFTINSLTAGYDLVYTFTFHAYSQETNYVSYVHVHLKGGLLT